jgi:hypothetical protein
VTRHGERRSRIPTLEILTIDQESGLLDEACFELVAAGAVDVAARSRIEVSLILLAPPVEAAGSPRRVGEVVSANVRSIDVVGRLADGTVAILMEASGAGALRAASRMRRLLGEQFGGAAWAGLATVTGGGSSAELLVAATSVALGMAKRDPWGWTEVVSGLPVDLRRHA